MSDTCRFKYRILLWVILLNTVYALPLLAGDLEINPAHIGLTIAEIVVSGNDRTQEKWVLKWANIEVGQPIKGPDLTKLGNMSKADLAEAIIRPGATIAKSWVNVTMKDGSSHLGTIVKKDAKLITLHNITGMATKLDAKKVSKVAPGLNMMSLHLVDGLNLQQFADLVEYIQSMDSKRKKRK